MGACATASVLLLPTSVREAEHTLTQNPLHVCGLQPSLVARQSSPATPQLTVRSFELGVMFLPSLLRRPASFPDEDGDHRNGVESLDFTCTPGEMGLTQRFPLTLRYECEPGKAVPLELLPLPYVLPGES